MAASSPRPRSSRLTNSLEITLVVTALSVLLAYPLAWIIAERVPRRLQRLALLLAVLPFWTSYVVRFCRLAAGAVAETASSTRR